MVLMITDHRCASGGGFGTLQPRKGKTKGCGLGWSMRNGKLQLLFSLDVYGAMRWTLLSSAYALHSNKVTDSSQSEDYQIHSLLTLFCNIVLREQVNAKISTCARVTFGTHLSVSRAFHWLSHNMRHETSVRNVQLVKTRDILRMRQPCKTTVGLTEVGTCTAPSTEQLCWCCTLPADRLHVPGRFRSFWVCQSRQTF